MYNSLGCLFRRVSIIGDTLRKHLSKEEMILSSKNRPDSSEASPQGDHVAWPSPKQDVIISNVLVILSVIVGGLGFYFTLLSWHGIPLLGVACLLWGLSCVGLRRLSQVGDGSGKRDRS